MIKFLFCVSTDNHSPITCSRRTYGIASTAKKLKPSKVEFRCIREKPCKGAVQIVDTIKQSPAR